MSEWIDCKQRMPEEGEPLLIVWNGVVQHLTYNLHEGEWYAHHQDPDEETAIQHGFVTHWMTLPAPPETT
jgi:hypothetical protein